MGVTRVNCQQLTYLTTLPQDRERSLSLPHGLRKRAKKTKVNILVSYETGPKSGTKLADLSHRNTRAMWPDKKQSFNLNNCGSYTPICLNFLSMVKPVGFSSFPSGEDQTTNDSYNITVHVTTNKDGW